MVSGTTWTSQPLPKYDVVPDEPEITKLTQWMMMFLMLLVAMTPLARMGRRNCTSSFITPMAWKWLAVRSRDCTNLRPYSRPFVLTRSGTAGVERYAAIWTGDNWSRYPYILDGYPDVPEFEYEWHSFCWYRYRRFLGRQQRRIAGSFCPTWRLHAILSQPQRHGISCTGTMGFGEPYESAYRKAIEARYQLMPYLYNLFHAGFTTGAP